MRCGQVDAQFGGEVARGIGEGINFGGDHLGHLLAARDFAAYEHGGILMDVHPELLEGLRKDQHLGIAIQIFEQENGHGLLAGLGDAACDGGDDAADTGLGVVIHAAKLFDGRELVAVQDGRILGQGMPAHVNAQQLAFARQHFALMPRVGLGQCLGRGSGFGSGEHIEQVALAGALITQGGGGAGGGEIDALEDAGAVQSEAIHAPGADQAFERLLVEQGAVDP